MDAFLNKDELYTLTGSKDFRKQANWLEQNGWIFAVNSKGYPVVGREYCNAKMAGGILRYDNIGLPDFTKVE